MTKNKVMRIDKNESELISLVRAVKTIDKDYKVINELKVLINGFYKSKNSQYLLDILESLERCL